MVSPQLLLEDAHIPSDIAKQNSKWGFSLFNKKSKIEYTSNSPLWPFNDNNTIISNPYSISEDNLNHHLAFVADELSNNKMSPPLRQSKSWAKLAKLNPITRTINAVQKATGRRKKSQSSDEFENFMTSEPFLPPYLDSMYPSLALPNNSIEKISSLPPTQSAYLLSMQKLKYHNRRPLVQLVLIQHVVSRIRSEEGSPPLPPISRKVSPIQPLIRSNTFTSQYKPLPPNPVRSNSTSSKPILHFRKKSAKQRQAIPQFISSSESEDQEDIPLGLLQRSITEVI
jgi:hypothetical protein